MSLVICLSLWSSNSYAQQCAWVKDSSGKVPDVIKVDNEVFFLFSEERARETARRLKNYSLLEDELALTHQSIELHKTVLKTTEEICESTKRMLDLERESFKRLSEVVENAPAPAWYENAATMFIFGSVTGIVTATVIFWIGSKQH